MRVVIKAVGLVALGAAVGFVAALLLPRKSELQVIERRY
jgi:hypothetical protein